MFLVSIFKMVVEYFRARRDNMNGIIKANYINNKTKNIVVNASSIEPNYGHIYLSAILEDNDSYYQSYDGDTYPVVNITFEKHILLTHFSLKIFYSFGKPWMYPSNWTLKGCNGDICRVIANNSNKDYFTQLISLTPVSPGVYQKFSFQANRNYKESAGCLYVISRIEFFGYACDSGWECNGNVLLKTHCQQKNTFNFLSIAIFIYIKILS